MQEQNKLVLETLERVWFSDIFPWSAAILVFCFLSVSTQIFVSPQIQYPVSTEISASSTNFLGFLPWKKEIQSLKPT